MRVTDQAVDTFLNATELPLDLKTKLWPEIHRGLNAYTELLISQGLGLPQVQKKADPLRERALQMAQSLDVRRDADTLVAAAQTIYEWLSA